MKRTERKGIVTEINDFDYGYWARYNGEPIEKSVNLEERDGWNTADAELREEKKWRRHA